MRKKLTVISDNTDKKPNDILSHAAFTRELTLDVMARTLWGEARGEGKEGMQAVANVILNRLHVAMENGGFWWGNTIIEICQKPYQFSCWNQDDANLEPLMQVDSQDLYFATAIRLSRRALANVLEDITNGATHYHADYVLPSWTKNQKACAKIGRHIFYRLEA